MIQAVRCPSSYLIEWWFEYLIDRRNMKERTHDTTDLEHDSTTAAYLQNNVIRNYSWQDVHAEIGQRSQNSSFTLENVHGVAKAGSSIVAAINEMTDAVSRNSDGPDGTVGQWQDNFAELSRTPEKPKSLSRRPFLIQ